MTRQEVELISDGHGLVITGRAGDVDRFLAEHSWLGNSHTDSSGRAATWLRALGNVTTAAGQVAEHSSRYLKLTKDSAEQLRGGKLISTGEDGISYAMVGKPGAVGKWLKVETGVGSTLTNPAVLASLGGLLTQCAHQMEAQELKALLLRMDEKLDDVGRAHRDQLLARLGRAAEAISEAMILREHGGDPETLWNKVDGESSVILEVQKTSLLALTAFCEKAEGKTRPGELKQVAHQIEGDVAVHLYVLARCFELQDEFAVLELDHVLETAPGRLPGHTVGLNDARRRRREKVLAETSEVMNRLDGAGGLAARNVLLHVRAARSTHGALNRTADTIEEFHQPMGITYQRQAVALPAWRDAVKDLDQLKTAGVEIGQKVVVVGGAAIAVRGARALRGGKNS